MDTLDSRCSPVNVYVLESNPLAAEHLQRILSKDRQFVLKILKNLLPNAQLSVQQERCVLVISQSGISYPFPVFVEGLEQFFPDAGLVFVGELEFLKELQQLTRRERVGFVTYPDVAKKLIPTVRRIVSRVFAENALLDEISPGAEPPPVWGKMTRRETEILELVQYRLSNKEIASILNVAEVTVKFHVSNILSKAKVDRRRNLLGLVGATLSASLQEP